jgi:hypothetical protein
MVKSARQRQDIGNDVLFEEYMLRRVARSRNEIERETTDALSMARAAGISWARIGELLEMAPPVAQRRHETGIERALGA